MGDSMLMTVLLEKKTRLTIAQEDSWFDSIVFLVAFSDAFSVIRAKRCLQ